MNENLQNSFKKIGAKVRISAIDEGLRRQGNLQLDVANDADGEVFEIRIRQNLIEDFDLSVLEVLPKDRHLVLLVKHLDAEGNTEKKEHFLCGHDERHLFVAAVGRVSTVAAAKDSLKPEEIVFRQKGLPVKKRHRRKTEQFKRQGEWFFVPANVNPDPNLIRRYEPLVRGNGSKAHIAQFAYRSGGEMVKVCPQYPNGVTMPQFAALVKRNPKVARLSWIDMRRNPWVYVKGQIRHPDHATITLDTWHRVLLNTERMPDRVRVTFLD